MALGLSAQIPKVNQPIKDNLINLVNSGTSYYLTTPNNAQWRAVYIADDFTLPEDITISAIKIYGTATPEFINSFNVLSINIYNDTQGKPSGIPDAFGTGMIYGAKLLRNNTSDVSITNTSGSDYTITATINSVAPVNLNKNTKYWLNVTPFVASNGAPFYQQPIFYSYHANLVGDISKFVVPYNVMMQGYTSWTDTTTLQPFQGLAFTIEGVTRLGTKEFYSNFKKVQLKNSTVSNLVEITEAGAEKISHSDIYAVTGQKMGTFTGYTYDSSALSTGKYHLVVTLSNGETVRLNFMKK